MKSKLFLISIIYFFFSLNLTAQDIEDSWDKIRREGRIAINNNRFFFKVSNLFVEEEDKEDIPSDILKNYIYFPDKDEYEYQPVFGYESKITHTMYFMVNPEILNLNWLKYRAFMRYDYNSEQISLIRNYVKSNDFSKEFRDIDDFEHFYHRFGDTGVSEIKKNIEYITPLIKTWSDLYRYRNCMGNYRLDLLVKHFASLVNTYDDLIHEFDKYFKDSEEREVKYLELYNKDAILIEDAINYINSSIPKKVNSISELLDAVFWNKKMEEAFDTISLIYRYKDDDPKGIFNKIQNNIHILYQLNRFFDYIGSVYNSIPSSDNYGLWRGFDSFEENSRYKKLSLELKDLYGFDESYKFYIQKTLEMYRNRIDKIEDFQIKKLAEIEGKAKQKEEKIRQEKCRECTIDFDRSRLPDETNFLGFSSQDPGIIKMKNGLEIEFYWDKKKNKWYIEDGMFFREQTYFDKFDKLLSEALKRCYKKYNCN